mmetsp:Transcript_108602/g.338576  ORF Transcript_108602/g.338576 Transcript_108602/m.338576 type:complete len:432 (-) Transcript_108602:213-1508(-)
MAAVKQYKSRAEDDTLRQRVREASRAIVNADKHFNKWELDEAVAASKKALGLFRDLSDATGVADALCILIRSLGSQENVEEAGTMAKSELAKFRSLGDAVGEAKMLLLQSEMCYNQEDKLDDAVAIAREAEALFEQEGNELGQAMAWMAMAEAHMAAGKVKAAVHPAQKATRLFRKAGDEHEEVRANLLASKADVSSLYKGSRESTWTAWEEALWRAEEGLKQARGVGDLPLVASALVNLAEVQNCIGSFDDALKASTEATELYYESGTPQDIASALHWTADTHIKCERFKEAKDVVQEIRRLAKEQEDESLDALATEILESMSAPGPSQEEEAPGDPEDKPPPPPPPPGKLVRNQQGDVMDLRSGMTFKPTPMHPMKIADITARILASYIREEFDNEVPLMEAGIAGPMSAEIQSEWHRKYMLPADQALP